MNENYIIKKSNYFIMNSSYDLSLQEQKIILTLASMVQPDDKEFKPYRFSISEFMNLLGVDTKTKYTEVPKITKELMKKVFEIKEGDTIIQTAWLAGAKYLKGSGYVELIFSPYLKPYMLQLSAMFTQYKLANILSMKSKYSSRIYELLKCNQFRKQGFIIADILELRHLLKATNIYPLYADFKRYIILPSQKELKKLTDINFDFEEIKTGRKITAIKFYIFSNQLISGAEPKQKPAIDDTKPIINLEAIAPHISEPVKDIDDLCDELRTIIPEPLSTKDLKALLSASNNNIQLIKDKYQVAKIQGNINNLTAFLISAIKNDFNVPISIKGNHNKAKRHGFINYEQRDDWDFEELGRLDEQFMIDNLKIHEQAEQD